MSEERGVDVSEFVNRGESVAKEEPKVAPASRPMMVFPRSVRENSEVQNRLIDEASEWLGGAREGTHVSDLIHFKKAYWQKTHPEILPTEEEVGYYLAGRGHHGIIQYITTKPEHREYEVEYGGVVGHIDMLHDVPIEVKTTRDYELKSEKELVCERSHYFEQLGFYCAMVDTHVARLYLLYLSAKAEGKGTEPKIKVYDVEYGELDPIRKEMLRRKEKLKGALDEADPSLLSDCPEWMCSNCRYRTICKGGGNGD